MFRLWGRNNKAKSLPNSTLFDEKSFYKAFLNDLAHCEREVIIISPFITNSRAQIIRPILQKLVERKVNVFIITRHPNEHEESMAVQAEGEIAELEMIGVKVLLTNGNYHQKLAILDKKVLWEGSLNIMSQVYSREVMRRIENRDLASEMFKFLKLNKFKL